MTYTFTYAELTDALIRLELIEHDEEASDSGDIWTAYSGRGMYGATCLGSTLGDGDNMMLIWELFDPTGTLFDTRSTVADILNTQQSDSMGRGTIRYWPEIVITD